MLFKVQDHSEPVCEFCNTFVKFQAKASTVGNLGGFGVGIGVFLARTYCIF